MKKLILMMMILLYAPLINAEGANMSTSPDRVGVDAKNYKIVVKGTICPFTGYLLSFGGVASIISNFELQLEKQKLEIKKIKGLHELYTQKQDELSITTLRIETEKYEQIIKLKDSVIAKYRTQYNPKKRPWYDRLWIGIATGVITSVALVYGGLYMLER